MIHPKILVAENEPQRADLLRASLESAGFQVLDAADSASAWKIIRMQRPVLALMDEDLPGLRENNIIQSIRSDPRIAQLPVLVLGEMDSFEEAIEWLNLGADDYISRTISPGLLKAEVYAKLRYGKCGED